VSNDTVSGKAAVDLAFLAYENGRKSALAEPQRLRVQAALGVPADITVGGEITPRILRNIAKLLLATAEVLEEDAAARERSEHWSHPQVEGESPREELSNNPPPSSEGEG
jgi:hypothetical protein